MADTSKKLYEGLFLLSQQTLSNGLASGIDTIQTMLDRAEANTIALGKWDERKLAYPIEGQKRGTFFLAVFEVDPLQIANIERDCNLSEDVLRVMFLRAEHYGEVEIEQAKQLAQQTADEANLREAPTEAPAEAPATASEPQPDSESGSQPESQPEPSSETAAP
ncbi:MAG: 30S ribosomal protein S6 [Phycisphaeraceae bacterium]